MDHFAQRLQDNQFQNDVLSRTFKSTLGDLMGGWIPQDDVIMASSEALPHPLQNLPDDFEESYLNLLNIKGKLIDATKLPIYKNRRQIIEKYIEKINEQLHIIEKLVKHLDKLTIHAITNDYSEKK